MPTWRDIQEWRFSSLESVVDELVYHRRQAAYADEAMRDLDPSPGWSGRGASTARTWFTSLADTSALLLANLDELLAVTIAMQSGMGEVEILVLEAQSLAAHHGFAIDETGSVTDPRPNAATHRGADGDPVEIARDDSPREREESLRATAALVSRALAKAHSADEAFHACLSAISTGQAGGERPADGPRLRPVPSDAGTEEVAAWWESLTEEEKRLQIAEHADVIGVLDGIRAGDRDIANRARLTSDIENVQKLIDVEHQKLLDSGLPYSQADVGRFNSLLSQREELEELAKSIGDSNAEPARQLLLYDPATGDPGRMTLHVAVSIGDVDTATHVSTFVPGMTIDVRDSIVAYASDMANLRDQSIQKLREHGEASVATIVWQGYDVPAEDSPERTELGAKDLRSFEEGIYDSRSHAKGGAPPHISVLGYSSCGSATAGHAMADIRPGVVGDFIMCGPPREPEHGAHEFNVPAGHTFTLRYDDPEGNEITDDPPERDPVSTTGFTTLDPVMAEPRWAWQDPSAHNDYLDDQSQTQGHVVDVVTGD